jgi:hypothetical protein
MKILLIAVYYGRWPAWFPAFLRSCRFNPSVDWLIVTDLPPPPVDLPNVRFLHMTMPELAARATRRLGVEVRIARPYKICDLRPAFGVVFEVQLEGYDFWGHCDLDVIWGDIRAFVPDSVLTACDVISARKDHVCGHFTLFRNREELNSLFGRDATYPTVLRSDSHYYYDEVGMTALVRAAAQAGRLKVHWPRFLPNFPDNDGKRAHPSRIGPYVNRWVWRDGKVFHRGVYESEVMYLHFMTWNRSLRTCHFGYDAEPASFYISYSHIGTDERDRPAGGIAESVRCIYAVLKS